MCITNSHGRLKVFNVLIIIPACIKLEESDKKYKVLHILALLNGMLVSTHIDAQHLSSDLKYKHSNLLKQFC